LNVLLQLVTYRIPLVSATKGEREREKQQTFHLVHFAWCLVESDNALKSVKLIPALHETHTRILSETTGRYLSI
jgi:hypothetical protein